jgi:hypothetical protein
LGVHVQKADQSSVGTYLLNLFEIYATPPAYEWLSARLQELENNAGQQKLYTAFSAATRFAGKDKLHLTEAELQEAHELLPGFNPQGWTMVQLARTILVLQYPSANADAYVQAIETLFGTADMGEQVALYGALALLPYPEQFVARASEGVRTNMGDVLESIMLNNPYPAAYLPEGAWNQMVLKAVFTGKPLYKIWGLDERSNPALATMLINYAHERWAAGRFVSPELWRPVSRHMTTEMLADIKKVFLLQEEIYKKAASLACAHSNLPEAKELLGKHPLYRDQIESGELTWNKVGQEWTAPQF